LGLPVESSTGAAIAAVAVAATQARMTAKRVADILPLLRNAARQVASLLRQ
jgi:DNA-binding IclR family transcriptional regulator